LRLYIGFIGFEIYTISFWQETGLFLVCLTVEDHAGMPENYRFMMGYE
jgi:hypothetical protein